MLIFLLGCLEPNFGNVFNLSCLLHDWWNSVVVFFRCHYFSAACCLCLRCHLICYGRRIIIIWQFSNVASLFSSSFCFFTLIIKLQFWFIACILIYPIYLCIRYPIATSVFGLVYCVFTKKWASAVLEQDTEMECAHKKNFWVGLLGVQLSALATALYFFTA